MTTATCLRRARAAELLEDEALVERGGRLEINSRDMAEINSRDMVERGGRLRRALGLVHRHPRLYLGYLSRRLPAPRWA